MLAVFLSSTLGTLSIAPTIAENPVISEVERLNNVCYFHLMTGQYPNGVWVGGLTPEGPTYYEEKGYLALTYRNLSPLPQIIRLTTTPGANHSFQYWPEKKASEWFLIEEDGSTWTERWVVPDEEYLMDDLWLIGWDLDSEVAVTLEVWDAFAGHLVLYQGTLTIIPPGP